MHTPLLPHLRPLIAASALLATGLPGMAATQVLYDAARDTTPTTAGWLTGLLLNMQAASSIEGTQIYPFANGTEPSGYGGYANHQPEPVFFPEFQLDTGALINPLFPVLDRQAGYRLDLDLRVQDEFHPGNNHRAGFSITLIGNDLRGIEIGFQNDRIFAQDNGAAMFTAGESTSDAGVIAALAGYRGWSLAVAGDGYTLSLDGSSVLSGALRDYSAYTGLGQDAYRTPNFLFLGDNTASAYATTGIRSVAISVSAVPEPAQVVMLLVGLAVVGHSAMRRRAR